MNKESIRAVREERAARRRRKIIYVAVPALLIIVALTTAKPLYHAMKARRATQIASWAESLHRAGKMNEAAEKYRAALQFDPLGYRPLRGAALLAGDLHHAEAVDLWEQVARLPQAVPADLQNYADQLLLAGRVQAAEPVIDKLLRIQPDAKTLELASRSARATGDRNKAIEFAQLAVKRAPNDDRAQFHLAQCLAESPR